MNIAPAATLFQASGEAPGSIQRTMEHVVLGLVAVGSVSSFRLPLLELPVLHSAPSFSGPVYFSCIDNKRKWQPLKLFNQFLTLSLPPPDLFAFPIQYRDSMHVHYSATCTLCFLFFLCFSKSVSLTSGFPIYPCSRSLDRYSVYPELSLSYHRLEVLLCMQSMSLKPKRPAAAKMIISHGLTYAGFGS
ncbi:hypothetical protein SAY87_003160 [Trapa incisa]|uniref:Uncharacterized protein n=1 Tax=Trapa incisa TaxID=236973 RepID=A0AAN7QHN3_9MYRT|nr:hypothetical protein SAY87_003160 [Trapa incisa]